MSMSMMSRVKKRQRRDPIEECIAVVSLITTSQDEKKEDSGERRRKSSQGSSSNNSLSDQRAARMRRRRRKGCSTTQTTTKAASSVVPRKVEAASSAAIRENEMEDDNNRKLVPDYTTAYTVIRQKYPQQYSKIMMEGRGGTAGIIQSLKYQYCHKMDRKLKRALAMKLTRKRWKSQSNRPNNESSSVGKNNATIKNNDVSTIHSPNHKTMQPTLAYRRTNIDYSSGFHYQNMTFLNTQTIVALDSYGDLDIIGLPLLSSTTWRRRIDGDNDKMGNNDCGLGTHLARMSIYSAKKKNGGLHNQHQQPRCPISQSHFELFGYQNGEKFSVGLPSGQVRLFSSERLELTVMNDWGSCRKCLATHRPNNGTTTVRAPDNAILWSCLPPNLGPRRRYRRNDDFPLSSIMLSLRQKDKKEALLESFNDYATFEEISGWDDDGSFSLERHPPFIAPPHPPNHALWAFREGGNGGGALLGAFVDPELDCFSLRMVDERVGGGNSVSSSAKYSSPASVFVDTSCHSSTEKPWAYDEDHVKSICFSGEHGLVTYHTISRGEWGRENVIKWWDHRMLRSRPVNASNLVFPNDRVAGVSPAVEYSLSGYSSNDRGESSGWRSLSLLSTDDGVDSSFRSHPEQESYHRDNNVNLVGSNDFSDRFAISYGGWGDEGFVIVDSPRKEIVRSERSNGFVSPCFSGNLDLVACHAKEEDTTCYAGNREEDAKDCISIFDTSRHASCNIGDNDSYESVRLGEKKRRSEYSSSGAADEPRDKNANFLGNIRPKFRDLYGIESTLSCMAMDELGCSIACGTNDGDIFLLQGQR